MAGDVLPVAMFYDMRPFRIQKDQFLHNTQKGWKMGWHLVEWWKLEGGFCQNKLLAFSEKGDGGDGLLIFQSSLTIMYRS